MTRRETFRGRLVVARWFSSSTVMHMSNRGSSVSRHFRTTKEIPQDAAVDSESTSTTDETEFGVPEQDVSNSRSFRSQWNSDAPINRIPPEILSLVPHCLDRSSRDRDIITLTHVCQTWRDVFVSCPSLWTNLSCVDADKTLVYLERSKSSPINLLLNFHDRSPFDTFVDFIPHATGRLKSLDIDGPRLKSIATSLSRPAPLLEGLSIRYGGGQGIPSPFLNGDFSPLHRLHLDHVRTRLPWRNMVNLTSFTLVHGSPISVSQYLDFFESAPHLHRVRLWPQTQISITGVQNGGVQSGGVQNGRLVSLACLKYMTCGDNPYSDLFDHLLIPVGAHLAIQAPLPRSPIKGSPPRFLDNLRNLSDFTIIKCKNRHMQFNGPNGEVEISFPAYRTCSVLGYLAHFDTSKTRRLEVERSRSRDQLHQALLPMKYLRTLTLTHCENPHLFVHVLQPSMSSSGVLVCPELEELVINDKGPLSVQCEGGLDIKGVVRMAAARASRGVKLKAMKIVSWFRGAYDPPHVELKKYVSHVDTFYSQIR